MQRIQKGFTLVELMIVIAIVGIIAASAIPMYLDYTVRSQVAEGITIAGGAKVAVTEFYQDRGLFPADNPTAGLSPANQIVGKYVLSVTVADEVITIQYGNDANTQINGESITLTAVDNDGSISWLCASAGVIEDKHLPTSCR